MPHTLPDDFIRQMSGQLGSELEPFLASYEAPRTYGIRLQPHKVQAGSPLWEELAALFGLEPIPWCPTGYYYKEETRPGKHPYHAAGLYYLQEPSAMSSAELLAPLPGETVLDMAAAPGGKSTQLSAMIGPQGLLVANEIHPARAQILAENIERMGAANTIVVQSPPDRLAERFPCFFDKIMLDAPCSGEGMFRKDEAAQAEWSLEHVAMCAARQLDIFRHALTMLKPGGTIAYSTCTFNRKENEELVEAVLREYPALTVLRTERLWPHKVRGEGHFVAVLQLAGEEAEEPPQPQQQSRKSGKTGRQDKAASLPAQTAEAWRLFQEFADGTFAAKELLPPGEPLLFGEQLYWLPSGREGRFRSSLLTGLKSPRPGLHLAAIRKKRVEPAHALALAMPADAFRRTVSFPVSSPEAAAYLRGEVLDTPSGLADGWVPVCAGCQPLGWAKSAAGQLKNHYPKGLRSR
jgi:16S rRNA C967 or C1407 C5-methylase (RsmB/RsmF family)/NOL1/NOP2/fmu family ribosome biogenesis protein